MMMLQTEGYIKDLNEVPVLGRTGIRYPGVQITLKALEYL